MRRRILILLGVLLLLAIPTPAALSQETQNPAQNTAGNSAQNSAEESGRKIVVRSAPAYPELARKLHLEGTVRLMVTVAPDGTAKAVEVLGGNPVLLKAAQDSVYKCRWISAARESKEVIEIKFHP